MPRYKIINSKIAKNSILFIIITAFLALSPGCIKKEIKKNRFRNIILITIDALRPDHLGAYGYERNTSPNIDKIAGRGVVFTKCFSHAPWTVPSMVSMFTSTLPPTHRNIHAQIENNKIIYQEVISDDFVTLPEFMKTSGYTTAGFSTNGHLIRKQGFAQGFDFYDENCLWESAECVNEKVINWIESNYDKKMFLWVHYIDAHADHLPGLKGRYNPPQKYKDMFKVEGDPMGKEVSESLYDGEIRYCDDTLGDLLKELDKFGILDNSAIVITSDHGESFMEHGKWYHTDTVYNEAIRVPLIITYPDIQKKRKFINRAIGLIDILPTLIDFAGIKPIPQIQGKSLIPLIEGNPNWKEENVYSETRRWENLDFRTIISGDYKYILDFKTGKDELYNLEEDPLEANNIIENNTKIAADLRQILESEIKEKEKLAKKVSLVKEIEKERIEKLKSLGYIK